MNKYNPLITLILGLLIGWAVATFIARRNIDRMVKTWSPEYQQYVAESAEFAQSLTSEELEQMRKDIHEYAQYNIDENLIKTLWQAVLAMEIRNARACDDTNRINRLLDDRSARLKEYHTEGRYNGTEWERLANKMVSNMENTNKIANHGLESTGAPPAAETPETHP